MNQTLPPPLPSAESALRTYLRAVIFLSPAFIVWLFASIFVVPRLMFIWERAEAVRGVRMARAKWLIDVPDVFKQHFWVIVVLVVSALFFCELFITRWPPYRRVVVASATFILNAAVLIFLLVACIAAMVLVPILIESK